MARHFSENLTFEKINERCMDSMVDWNVRENVSKLYNNFRLNIISHSVQYYTLDESIVFLISSISLFYTVKERMST